jgi:Flp pilus assembly pilin Flp
MNSIAQFFVRLHRDQDGQGMVEYILVMGLIALGAIAGSRTLANTINNAFTSVGNKLNNSVS